MCLVSGSIEERAVAQHRMQHGWYALLAESMDEAELNVKSQKWILLWSYLCIKASLYVVASYALFMMIWGTWGMLFWLSPLRGSHLLYDHQDYRYYQLFLYFCFNQPFSRHASQMRRVNLLRKPATCAWWTWKNLLTWELSKMFLLMKQNLHFWFCFLGG